MQIEAVIIFPNVRGIFDYRKKIHKNERVGWVVSKWELRLINNKMLWIRIQMDADYNTHTLSLDKKKVAAKRYNLPIIYIDKRRAKHIMSRQSFDDIRLNKIPFHEQDLK
jgi:hypothetical protein